MTNSTARARKFEEPASAIMQRTDGIRNRANAGLLTTTTAMKISQSSPAPFWRAATWVVDRQGRLLGLSPMETALVASFTSIGMDVILTGRSRPRDHPARPRNARRPRG